MLDEQVGDLIVGGAEVGVHPRRNARGSHNVRDGGGGFWHGYLHGLPRQSDSFQGVVAPTGGADVREAASGRDPQPLTVEIHAAAPELVAAERPVILAGGGVVRSGAQEELRRVAEQLDAPVVTTIGGKAALPWDHELSARCWIEDIATTEFLESADVLLIVGSGVGELSSNYHTFRPAGRVLQIEADLGKIGANHPCRGIHGDARLALAGIADELAALGAHSTPERRESARSAIRELLATLEQRLDGQDLATERALLAGLRAAVPPETPVFWDMTLLAYWAWSAWDASASDFHSGQGAGGLGYGLPAAIGAAFAGAGPTLAVSGDGGALYGIAELATLAQESLPVTWFIVDDGGYGILREYMEGEFGAATATELARPDFVALAEAFGVAAEKTTVADAPEAVRRALESGQPRVVVLPAVLRMFEPTHLHRR
ncbi:acetolactate synthase [Corynebacterium heidelbergense]|uniref:acetolactate synthase n=1 Tax=Corynebacterium heidelbergense TaxID=2055947 RepID=A0A364VB11_9CORY|nr:acetolactate synthase [Corynebacterium heidelbergense]